MEAPLPACLPALHDVVGVPRACFGISTVSVILVMFSDVRLTDRERQRQRERASVTESEKKRVKCKEVGRGAAG